AGIAQQGTEGGFGGAKLQVLVDDKGFAAAFPRPAGGKAQRVELQPPSAAAGDDRKRLLVADLHLAADAAADVQAALVDRPSADEIAAGDGKNGGILAFGGELRRFGKGNVL